MVLFNDKSGVFAPLSHQRSRLASSPTVSKAATTTRLSSKVRLQLTSGAWLMSQRLISGLGLFILLAVALYAPGALAQAAQAGNNTNVETFQDWDVRCPEQASDGACEMTQLVNSPDNGKPILRVVMGYPPQVDSAAMVFILPLGTRLAPGVQFQVDNGEPKGFPFQICLEQGCRADFPVDNALRSRMRAGSSATVSLIGPQGDRIDLDVSLQGFTDADNRIRQ